MAKFATPQTRVLARFGRNNDRQIPWRAGNRNDSHGYACDANARGL
jgi:hypothetical protein